MIREWRKHRGYTLEQLAARVEGMTGKSTTHSLISRIERGVIAYTQPMLEAIAEALNVSPADLLMRYPPTSAEYKMWSIWDQLPAAKKKTAAKLLEALKDAEEDAA